MTLLEIIGFGLAAYILAVIIGPIFIDYFKKLSVRQVVREEGLESHHKKTGTPTMGGFIFLLPMTVVVLIGGALFSKLSTNIFVILLTTLAFGAVGFIDDYRKVIKKHNEGLTSKEKLIAQVLIAAPLTYFAITQSTDLWIPFTNIMWDLGYFKALLVFVAIIATTNAVNLTDGVDGLSSSVTILVLMFYIFVGLRLDMMGVQMFSSILMMALLGFLLFNKNPAKVFMGDIGSLALGGAVVALAILTNTLLLIFIVGIIYVLETLSVTLQVLYYKKTQKRIFKMAPLHHHYELCGWNEKKIVRIFSVITFIGMIISIISFLPRR